MGIVTLDEMMDRLSPRDRERVEERARELIAEDLKASRDSQKARQTAKVHAVDVSG